MNNKSKFVLVASPRHFSLRYKKKDGTIKNYSKVLPMEIVGNNLMVAYIFGEGENRAGIRSFKQDGILDMVEV